MWNRWSLNEGTVDLGELAHGPIVVLIVGKSHLNSTDLEDVRRAVGRLAKDATTWPCGMGYLIAMQGCFTITVTVLALSIALAIWGWLKAL